MRVFGNVDSLKQEITAVMEGKLKELEKELADFKAETDRDIDRKIETLREQHKTTLAQDLKKEHSQILGEKTLSARKEYEEKREALIDKVFTSVLKKAKETTKSPKYINFVKTQLPSGRHVQAYGDNSYYKKFFPNMKLDNSIVGLRFSDGEVSYDFTVERMLNVRREELRSLVNAKLLV